MSKRRVLRATSFLGLHFAKGRLPRRVRPTVAQTGSVQAVVPVVTEVGVGFFVQVQAAELVGQGFLNGQGHDSVRVGWKRHAVASGPLATSRSLPVAASTCCRPPID